MRGNGRTGLERDEEAWGYGESGPAELDPDEEAWGRPGTPAPAWSASDDEDARKAEARLFNDQAWAIASTRDRDGATLELTAWAFNGALTLDSFRDLTPPEAPGPALGDRPFKAALQKALAAYVLNRAARVHLTFHRQGHGWTASINTEDIPAPPPYAKTLPVNQREVPAAAHDAIEKALGKWASKLRESDRPGSEWNLEVELDDDRVEGISTLGYQLRGAVASEWPDLMLTWEVSNLLLLHSEGVGKRKVRVVLRSELLPGERRPRWHPVSSTTERPPVQEAPEEEMTTAAEYHQLHERILRTWREDSAHYAMAAALFTAREVAFWVVGGWAERGFGAALHLAASPLGRAIERLGSRATPWLDCVLRRMAPAERKALLELWSKLEVQGEKGLAEAEKGRLRTLFRRVEDLTSAPLTEDEKEAFWRLARRRFWKSLDPKLASTLVTAEGRAYAVHHLIPLEYFELFEMDINAIENLVALAPKVHESVGRMWTFFRTNRMNPTAAEVSDVAAIINEYYGTWYNKTYNPVASASQLSLAEQSAQAAIRGMLKRLGTP